MVARTPPKQRKMFAHLNPTLLRETVNKVDKCMARLQELQYTVSGGTKVISGVSLSPRSTRSYLRTSLRCKQEYLRIKNANPRRSSPGKLPITTGEWRRMSLPAMLVGETVGEILQASQFAREIVAAVSSSRNPSDEPKTPPMTIRRRNQLRPNNHHLEKSSELRARRRREKQNKVQSIRSELLDSPSGLQRARSRRIHFKASSSPPLHNHQNDKENSRYMANRVSPRHRPWAKKTVLFPNPLFHSSPTSTHHKFCKTKSPIIARTSNHRQTPHKFLIRTRSPPPSSSSYSKFQVKIKKSPPLSLSPSRTGRVSPKAAAAASSTSTSTAAAKLRRSFSPSRLANRLISPLKTSKNSFVLKKTEGFITGLKQRSSKTPI